MSVCLVCLESFVPGVNERGKFCSQGCWREFEKRQKHLAPLSRLGYGSSGKKVVKKNLSEMIDEVNSDYYSLGEGDRSTWEISYNPELNPNTRKKLRDLRLKFMKLRLSLE